MESHDVVFRRREGRRLTCISSTGEKSLGHDGFLSRRGLALILCHRERHRGRLLVSPLRLRAFEHMLVFSISGSKRCLRLDVLHFYLHRDPG